MSAEAIRSEASEPRAARSESARVRLWHYGLPLAILIACIGVLAVALVQLTDIARTMRLDAPGNMLWVISQADIEALRTQNALANARLYDWDAKARDTVGLRYDILMSRLALLSEGPQQRFLANLGITETIANQTEQVESFDPNRRPFTEETARAFDGVLSELHATLYRSANRQMVAGWESQSSQMQRYRETVYRVIAAVLGVILGAMLLGWQIISGKQSLLRAEEARLRAIRLEHELEGVRATASYYRDFASVVSHQFRTRLAIIDSAAQRLVRSGKMPDMVQLTERRGIIRQTVARLTRLVDAALMAGRLDHGGVELSIAEHDLTELAGDIADEFRRGMPDRDIRVETSDHPVPVSCDAALVSHILMNLIDNALKYSPPDQPITVSFEMAGHRAACTVADRGDGISEADLPRIFERFRRGTGRTDTQSAGIGLWIARQLAVLQGGTLEFANRQGHGAAFTLWLPTPAPGIVQADNASQIDRRRA